MQRRAPETETTADRRDTSLHVRLAGGEESPRSWPPRLKPDFVGVLAFRPQAIRRRNEFAWLGEPSRPAFAESPAYHTLLRELRNYLNDEIRGRSFLVSGHRGAGKTSMVLRAVEDAGDEVVRASFSFSSGDRDVDGFQVQRPLLVRLHGPGLLAAMKEVASPKDGAASPAPPDGAEGLTPPGVADPPVHSDAPVTSGTGSATDAAMEEVLSQIMISTYRALTAEVTRCYRRHLAELDAFAYHVTDPVETLGQLSLDLDIAPPPELLREYWRRARALDCGVFWPLPVSRDGDQGMRELVALATAAQAYRVVTGAVTYKQDIKGEDSNKTSVDTASTLAGKEIADKALGFLSGGLLGGAYLYGHPGAVVETAAVGLATAFLASWTFKVATKRESKRTATQEYTFIRTSDASTLDRELPAVIERIRAAGLAPVFVVDELDKVDALEEAMADLIRRLKHIVADRSFFCFLTDRDYYEKMQEKSRRLPYPPEHTYFSHRLFILYRPENLRAYLDTIVASDVAADGDVALFRRLLSYLVMHRGMLHVFDLQRELSKVCDQEGRVTVKLSELLSHLGYRFHITIQLAVEHLLAEDEMRDRLNQDPHFGQLAYDALYRLSRHWSEGGTEVSLSEDAIEEYLARRIAPEWFEACRRGDEGAKARTPSDVLAESVSVTDRTFLVDRVRRLADMLAEPDALRDALAEADDLGELKRDVLGLVPGEERRMLDRTEDGVKWRYDYFGRLLPDKEAELGVVATAAAAREDGRKLFEINDRLHRLPNRGIDLRDLPVYGFLSRTPSWEQVVQAIHRLEDFAGGGAGFDERDVLADCDLVREFSSMLSERAETAWLAVTLVGQAIQQGGGDADLGYGMLVVSWLLQVLEREPEDVRTIVRRMLGELGQEDPFDDVFESLEEVLSGLDFIAGIQRGAVAAVEPDRFVAEFWEDVQTTIRRREGRQPTEEQPTLAQLTVALTGEFGFLVVEGVRERTIRGLTALFLGTSSKPRISPPEDLRLWAANTLGYSSFVRDVLQSSREFRTFSRLVSVPGGEGNPADVQWLTDVLDFQEGAPNETVLVVSHSTLDPRAPAWRTEPDFAALQLTENSALEMFDGALGLVIRHTTFTLALASILGFSETSVAVGKQLSSQKFDTVLISDAVSPEFKSDYPVIEPQRTLGQTIKAARKALRDSGARDTKAPRTKRSPRRPPPETA